MLFPPPEHPNIILMNRGDHLREVKKTIKKRSQRAVPKSPLRNRAKTRLISRKNVSSPSGMGIKPLLQELQVHQRGSEIQDAQRSRTLPELDGKTKRFEEFFDSIPIGCISIDRYGVIRRLNRMAADLIGDDRHKLIDQEFALFISEEGRLTFKSFLERIFAGAAKEACELTLINNRKNKILTISAAASENGEECLAILADVTALRKTEDALREREMHHRVLFENAGVAIVHVDAQGNFILVNKNFLEFSGYTWEELSEMNIKDITHPDYIEQTRELVKKQITGQINQFTQEKYYVCKNGALRWGEMRSTPLRDEHGRLLSAVVAIINRTKRKRAEEALLKSEAELRAKAQNLTEINMTLKVLLNSLEKDQEQLKEVFLTNIKQQVLPYLEKLKKRPLQDVEKGYVEMAESHLKEIASPFAQKLTSKYLNLTSKEITIASLIKEGKTSKEIAELVHVSKRDVDFHRGKIREKLGLKKQKGNLQILLRTFS